MPTKEEIERYLARRSKSARLLELLIERPSITCEEFKNLPETRTTSPHSLVKAIREKFGFDFVKYVDKKSVKTAINSKGQEYKITTPYREYFIEKMSGVA